MPDIPKMPTTSPEAVLAAFFRKKFPEIYKKIQLQVRRTPRRLTGPYKTNRASRWKLSPDHPDYTAADQIPRIEAKLFAMALEFRNAPDVPESVASAAAAVLGHDPKREAASTVLTTPTGQQTSEIGSKVTRP
jgi:hypothetical protein